MNTQQILNSFKKLVEAIDNRLKSDVDHIYNVYCDIPKNAMDALIKSNHPSCMYLKRTYMATFLEMYKAVGHAKGTVYKDYGRFTWNPKFRPHKPEEWWITLKSHNVDVACFTHDMITELRLYLNKINVQYPIYDWVPKETENMGYMLNYMCINFLYDNDMLMDIYNRNGNQFSDQFRLCEDCLMDAFPYFYPICEMPYCCLCLCINPRYQDYDKHEELENGDSLCVCRPEIPVYDSENENSSDNE